MGRAVADNGDDDVVIMIAIEIRMVMIIMFGRVKLGVLLWITVIMML